MKCTKCGSEFEGDFCPICGEPTEVHFKNSEISKLSERKNKIQIIIGLTAAVALIVGISIAGNSAKYTQNGDFLITANGSSAIDTTSSFVAVPASSSPVVPAAVASADDSTTPSSETPQVQTFPEGMYKVGTDLPAGEYILITQGGGYFSIAKDSTGELESIIANDNFSDRSIVTVKDGQYLTVTRATVYKISDAPAIDTSTGTLSDGMYRVGVDIKPGEYKLHATDGAGYYQVMSNSTHNFDSIISNSNFSGDKYLTIKKGQYLKIIRAELILK